MYSLYKDKLSVLQSLYIAMRVREDNNKTSHFDFWLIQSQSLKLSTAHICLQASVCPDYNSKKNKANCEQIWHDIRKLATRTDEPVSDNVLQAKLRA